MLNNVKHTEQSMSFEMQSPNGMKCNLPTMLWLRISQCNVWSYSVY